MKKKLKELYDTHEKEYLCGGLGIGEEGVDWMFDKMFSVCQALEFYANKDNYSHGYHDLLGEIESDVEMDKGLIARQTLGEEEVK